MALSGSRDSFSYSEATGGWKEEEELEGAARSLRSVSAQHTGGRWDPAGQRLLSVAFS